MHLDLQLGVVFVLLPATAAYPPLQRRCLRRCLRRYLRRWRCCPQRCRRRLRRRWLQDRTWRVSCGPPHVEGHCCARGPVTAQCKRQRVRQRCVGAHRLAVDAPDAIAWQPAAAGSAWIVDGADDKVLHYNTQHALAAERRRDHDPYRLRHSTLATVRRRCDLLRSGRGLQQSYALSELAGAGFSPVKFLLHRPASGRGRPQRPTQPCCWWRCHARGQVERHAAGPHGRACIAGPQILAPMAIDTLQRVPDALPLRSEVTRCAWMLRARKSGSSSSGFEGPRCVWEVGE
mmetsp:Transcript_50767/g.127979  ORF Transcript_50767/g.127979 Transcript_50767/m.127979 type:complete len:289 (-) Transcript_50767:375-1241(-)